MWLLVVLVLAGGGGVWMYNGLVRSRERAEAAWSDIDVQLKRRHDLIPALVETVKAYADHEQETLESVIRARSEARDAGSPERRAEAEERLAGTLRSLFAVAEDYPELRSSDNFERLQETISEVEDHIQSARRYYNAVVRDHNARIHQVPWVVVARLFGFREREFFGAAAGERDVPVTAFE